MFQPRRILEDGRESRIPQGNTCNKLRCMLKSNRAVRGQGSCRRAWEISRVTPDWAWCIRTKRTIPRRAFLQSFALCLFDDCIELKYIPRSASTIQSVETHISVVCLVSTSSPRIGDRESRYVKERALKMQLQSRWCEVALSCCSISIAKCMSGVATNPQRTVIYRGSVKPTQSCVLPSSQDPI